MKPVRLFEHDPLELNIKRSRYSRDLLNLIFRTPGSFLGKYSFNWMAAGALVDMIEAIFTSNEEVYAERRKALREMGMKHKPRPVHFDMFRVIVGAFPISIHRGDILDRLKAKYPDLTLEEVRAGTEYLKDFTVKICGFSIITDFAGGVILADVDARMKLHIHNRITAGGLRDTEERHGVQTLAALPGVRQLPPASEMPALDFEEERKALPDASD